MIFNGKNDRKTQKPIYPCTQWPKLNNHPKIQEGPAKTPLAQQVGIAPRCKILLQCKNEIRNCTKDIKLHCAAITVNLLNDNIFKYIC